MVISSSRLGTVGCSEKEARSGKMLTMRSIASSVLPVVSIEEVSDGDEGVPVNANWVIMPTRKVNNQSVV